MFTLFSIDIYNEIYRILFQIKFIFLLFLLKIFTKTNTIMQITLNCNHFEKKMNLLSPILFTLKNFILSSAKK